MNFLGMRTNKMEYGDGITIEQAKALYFDLDALLIAPRPVYRMDNKGKRFYFTFDKDNKPQFVISVTSFIAASLPTSPYLIDWIAEHGREKANELRDEAAAYGTLLHREIAHLLIEKRYNLDLMTMVVEEYVKVENLAPKCLKWGEKLKRDIASFAQFALDTNFKPLAIEIMLVDESLGLGGAVDIVGEMDIEEKGFFGEVYKSSENQGKPKESKQLKRILLLCGVINIC